MGRQHSYRDGVSHTRQYLERAAAKALAEGKQKLAGKRSRVPTKLKRELAALEQQLGQMQTSPIQTMDDARHREQQTEAYCDSLSAALLIVEESDAHAPTRIRRLGWLAILALVPLGFFTLFKVAEYSKTSARCALATPPAVANHAALFFAEEPRCQYQTSEECAATTVCKEKGHCSLREGRCRPATNEDCQASVECKTHGRCSLVGQSCQPAQGGDCRNNNPCKHWGACTAWSNECIATRNEDCAQSSICEQRGGCGLSSLYDVAADLEIPDELNAPAGECMPRNKADCSASAACANDRFCSLAGRECVFTKVDHCPASAECFAAGRCAWHHGGCVAETDEHCRASTGCKDHNRCVAYWGECRQRINMDCLVLKTASSTISASCTMAFARTAKAPQEAKNK